MKPIDIMSNKRKCLYYLLDENNNAVPVWDMLDDPAVTTLKMVEESLKSDKRVVCQQRINNYFISTVFLTIDFGVNWEDPNYKPILWETMIFDESKEEGNQSLYQERYTSHQEAIEGHNKVIQIINEGKIQEWLQELLDENSY